MTADLAPAGMPDAAAVARRERLWRLADDRGVVAGIAIDHRASLRAVLAAHDLGDLTTDEMRTLKLRLTESLATAATAIMLDEELGGLALDAGAVPRSVGLIMPLEAQGFGDGPDPVTTLMTDFTAADAAGRGADACKVLLPFRADRADAAARQEDVVLAAAGASHAAGLPLVIEPVIFALADEPPEVFATVYPSLVADAAARIGELGVDLLKLPFPVLDLATAGEDVAAAACRELDAACRETPWVLLGAGVDTDSFAEQVRIAGTAGASGFLVGRGIWGPALDRDPDEVASRAAGTARNELRRCRQIASRWARPLPHAA